MPHDDGLDSSRRGFLAHLGGAGAALALGALATPASADAMPSLARTAPEWDMSWLERVKRAKHRTVFDTHSAENVLTFATRYLDSVETVYGDRAPAVAAIVVARARAVPLALTDALWEKYPLGEDANVKDPATSAFAKRNIFLHPTASSDPTAAELTVPRLQSRGTTIVVCDFAMSFLASRIAAKVGSTKEAMHTELRAGLIPGAFLAPAGVFAMAEAQNAGCAYLPG